MRNYEAQFKKQYPGFETPMIPGQKLKDENSITPVNKRRLALYENTLLPLIDEIETLHEETLSFQAIVKSELPTYNNPDDLANDFGKRDLSTLDENLTPKVKLLSQQTLDKLNECVNCFAENENEFSPEDQIALLERVTSDTTEVFKNLSANITLAIQNYTSSFNQQFTPLKLQTYHSVQKSITDFADYLIQQTRTVLKIAKALAELQNPFVLGKFTKEVNAQPANAVSPSNKQTITTPNINTLPRAVTPAKQAHTTKPNASASAASSSIKPTNKNKASAPVASAPVASAPIASVATNNKPNKQTQPKKPKNTIDSSTLSSALAAALAALPQQPQNASATQVASSSGSANSTSPASSLRSNTQAATTNTQNPDSTISTLFPNMPANNQPARKRLSPTQVGLYTTLAISLALALVALIVTLATGGLASPFTLTLLPTTFVAQAGTVGIAFLNALIYGGSAAIGGLIGTGAVHLVRSTRKTRVRAAGYSRLSSINESQNEVELEAQYSQGVNPLVTQSQADIQAATPAQRSASATATNDMSRADAMMAEQIAALGDNPDPAILQALMN